MPLYLTEAEVEELLTPTDAFAAVEGSLERLARGEVDNRTRISLDLPDGKFAAMPCVDRGLGYAGLKTYAWAPGGTPFLVVLFGLDGTLEAIVEAERLSRLRTAAASAVASSRLAREGASSLGVFGNGRQAAAHITALRDALPGLEQVVVQGRNPPRVAAFCAEHGCAPAEEPREAAACDVVVTATTSTDPVLRGEWLEPGATVCAVGANDLSYRELDNVVLERAAFVCCDSRAQAREEAGDLVEPIERGVLDWLEVHELGEVVTGEVAGRAQADDIVVFKSSGLAAWDLAAAARVLELARERGVGQDVG
jgi:ornithine cyclodeaminase/alanine dehydrogenase-like protein (mu-crystallin family)